LLLASLCRTKTVFLNIWIIVRVGEWRYFCCCNVRGREGGKKEGGGGLMSFRIALGSESYNGRSKPDV
jgi:hypothetical protein